MKRRLVILTEIISPYRIPLFNRSGAECRTWISTLYFLAETDPTLRQWQVYQGRDSVLVSGASIVAKADWADTTCC